MNPESHRKATAWLVAVLFTMLSVYSPFAANTANGGETGSGGAKAEEIFIGEESKIPGIRSRTIESQQSSLVVYHLLKPVAGHGGISIEAAVEGEAPVKKVTLFYRTSGERRYRESRLNRVSSNTFEVTIPAKEIPDSGVEYYLSATDKNGNTGYDGSGDIPYFSEVAAASGADTIEKSVKNKTGNWWQWTLGAVVAGGAVAAVAALSSSGSSGTSGNSGTGGGGNTSSDTGKITGVWR